MRARLSQHGARTADEPHVQVLHVDADDFRFEVYSGAGNLSYLSANLTAADAEQAQEQAYQARRGYLNPNPNPRPSPSPSPSPSPNLNPSPNPNPEPEP